MVQILRFQNIATHKSVYLSTVGNTTVFHGRYSLFHTVGPDSLAELTCIFLVCDAYVANDN